MSDDDYIEGAPEFIAEIAASSSAIDLGDKKKAYCRNGVAEYLVWQVFDQRIDWFHRQAGQYGSLQPDEGVLKSRVFPGLWLDPSALLAGEMQQVFAVLQQGLQSAEHHRFVQQLAAQA